MRSKIFALFVTAVLIAASNLNAADAAKSTIEDQRSVEVTVYNNNLGLIKEVREVKLPKGQGELRFMDVPSYINPVTVRTRSLNAAKAFTVLEQNYEYDLINSDKLLDKYVGKKIKLIEWNAYKDRKEIVEAELLSNNDGQIFRIDTEIYLGHPGYKIVPEIPENLIAKPTLTWLYENDAASAHNLEVPYLTRSISWKADYVLVIDKDDKKAGISGWVTIDNKSGAAYNNASLKLVAGEVNIAKQEDLYEQERFVRTKEAKKEQFEERGFFEYHIYDLGRKTTIKDKQTKQISLLEANGIGLEKEYVVYGSATYFNRRYREENPKQPVNVYFKFKNSKKNNLGTPLPGGIMRMYKEDEKKSLQFIGEDKVEHTPKDEEARLKAGEAFDIVVERVQTDYKAITTILHETEWEITLKNHKEEDATINIVEPVYGNWKVVSSSNPYKKVDAFTLKYEVIVPKDKEVKVKYRIRAGLE